MFFDDSIDIEVTRGARAGKIERGAGFVVVGDPFLVEAVETISVQIQQS